MSTYSEYAKYLVSKSGRSLQVPNLPQFAVRRPGDEVRHRPQRLRYVTGVPGVYEEPKFDNLVAPDEPVGSFDGPEDDCCAKVRFPYFSSQWRFVLFFVSFFVFFLCFPALCYRRMHA